MLGYSGWAIHLPQALAGTASVALLYFLLRKPFGRTAALLAAFLLALSPIAVATDRSNNTDSWLVFFLLIAAWLALRGRGLSFVFAMAALGLAFNVKMLAALICGPALLAGWWLSTHDRLAAAAGLDVCRRDHAGDRLALLGRRLRSHARTPSTAGRQQQERLDARADRRAQRGRTLRARAAPGTGHFQDDTGAAADTTSAGL